MSDKIDFLPMPVPEPSPLGADGVGPLFKQTHHFIDQNLKPSLVDVTDPDSDITVIGVVDRTGVKALPPEFFDGARDNPRFRRGTARLARLESFIAHVKRFGDLDSVIFADDSRSGPSLTAVLDYHRVDPIDLDDAGHFKHGEYRHGKHRTTFAFPLSDEWKAWNAANGQGKAMTMVEFSTFLEDRLADIGDASGTYPPHVQRLIEDAGGPDRIASYGKLMELSKGLQVFETAHVEEAINLSSGEGKIRFTLAHDTKDATGGSVVVPKLFFIAIPIFAKGALYQIACRLRYRKTPQGLRFWYDLYRPDLSFDHAFNEAVDKVAQETGNPILYGAPEA